MSLHLNYHYILSQNTNSGAGMNKPGILGFANLLFEKPKRKISQEKKERKNTLNLSTYEMLKLMAKTKEKVEIIREINSRSKERGIADPIIDIKSITKEYQSFADSDLVSSTKEETHLKTKPRLRNISSEGIHKRPVSKSFLNHDSNAGELDKSVIMSLLQKNNEEKLNNIKENFICQGWNVTDTTDRSISQTPEVNKEILLPSINKPPFNQRGIELFCSPLSLLF